MKYYVYKITNTINGMFYIGKTYDIQKRFGEHIENSKGKASQTNLSKGIRKYGSEAFKIEQLYELPTDEDALIMEARTVLETGATDRYTGYNHANPKHGTPYKIMAAKKLSTENTNNYVVKESNGMRKEKRGTFVFINGWMFEDTFGDFVTTYQDLRIQKGRVFHREIFPVFDQPDVVTHTYIGNMINFNDALEAKTHHQPLYAEYIKKWKRIFEETKMFHEQDFTEEFFTTQAEMYKGFMIEGTTWKPQKDGLFEVTIERKL